MTNLIENGSFVRRRTAGWYGFKAYQAVAIDGGALSVVSTDEGLPASGIWYRPRGAVSVALDGLTELDAVGLAWSDEPDAHARFWLIFSDVPYLGLIANVEAPDATGTPIGATPTAFGGRGLAVPEGMLYVLVTLVGPPTVHYDDLYVGTPGGDAPPYPAAALPLGERVYNGTFEGGIDDWYAIWGGETLAHETASPLSGTGSLRVETPGLHAGEGVYDGQTAHVTIPGESLRVRAKVAGGGPLSFELNIYPAVNIVVWADTPSADPENPTVVDETVVIPSDAGPVEVVVTTVGVQAITFWLDDVSLLGPEEAEDPAGCLPGALLALGLGGFR